MNRAFATHLIPGTSSRFQARIALIYYLLTIVTGLVIVFLGSKLNFFVDVIAAAFYIGVTIVFYALTKRA